MPPAIDRQLLLGPPGSPLTDRVLEEFATRLRDPATDPRRVLLLVPNHAAVRNCQRRLQQRADLPALPDSIVPLSALPRRLGAMPPGRALPSMVESLLLRGALAEVAAKHRRQGDEPLLPAHRAGVLRAVRDQIRECKQAAYLPAKVEELLWNEPEARTLGHFPWAPLNRVFQEQGARHRQTLLQQFAEVWSAYETRIHADRPLPDGGLLPGWLDTADQLLFGAVALESAPPDLDWLGIDGFTEFTALQWRLLQPLLLTPVVRFALPVDRLADGFFLSEADPRRWFSSILIQERFFEAVSVQSDTGALTSLYGLLPAVTRSEPLASTPLPGVILSRPHDRSREVASVLRRVQLRIQADPAVRYRHHALVVRDLATYRPLLEREASLLGIPLRIEQSRPLTEHPLGQAWVRACRLLGSPEWTPAALLEVLQPLTANEAVFRASGQLQTYLSGRAVPTSPEEWRSLLKSLPAIWEESLAPVISLMADLLDARDHAATGDPQDFIDAAVGWLQGTLLPLWRREQTEAAEVGGTVASTLLTLATLLLELPVDAVALQEQELAPATLIEQALASTSWEVRDSRREVLRVVDAESARDIEADHIVILGLTLGSWPRRPASEPFFDDDLRRLLSETQRGEGAERHRRLDAWSRPDWKTEETTLALEGWLFRVACGRARSTLLLSAPATEAGQPVEPSPWWQQLAIASGTIEADLPGQRLAPVTEWVHPADAQYWLACWYREASVAAAQHDASGRHARGQLGLQDSHLASVVAPQLALALEAEAVVGPKVLEAAAQWPQGITGLSKPYPAWVLEHPSASGLNDLAQCAFKFFAGRVCRLTEPDPPVTAGLDPMMRGTLIHKALEEWSRHDPKHRLPALMEAFAEAWQSQIKDPDSPLYLPQRLEMERRLAKVADIEHDATPWERLETRVEVRFGADGEIALPLPGQDPFVFTGFIDRLDIVDFQGTRCVALMDYKNSKKSLKDKEKELQQNLANDEAEAENEWGAAPAASDVTLLANDVQLPLYAFAARVLTGLPVLVAFHYPLGAPDKRSFAFIPSTGTWRVEDWKSAELRVATDAEWARCMATLSGRISELLAQLAAGRIEPTPLIRRFCGPGSCAFARLCRYDDLPQRSRW